MADNRFARKNCDMTILPDGAKEKAGNWMCHE